MTPCKNSNAKRSLKENEPSFTLTPRVSIVEEEQNALEERAAWGVDFPFRIVYDPAETAEKIIQALNSDNPLQSALYALSWDVVQQSVLSIVTNSLPQTSENRYVTGLTGTYPQKLTIKLAKDVVREFAKNAKWSIRWDVDDAQRLTQQANGFLKGLHVNMEVDDGTTKLKTAFIPKDQDKFSWNSVSRFTSDTCPAGSVANTYYQIVSTLTEKAKWSDVLKAGSGGSNPPIRDEGGSYGFTGNAKASLDKACEMAGYKGKSSDVANQVKNFWNTIYNPKKPNDEL